MLHNKNVRGRCISNLKESMQKYKIFNLQIKIKCWAWWVSQQRANRKKNLLPKWLVQMHGSHSADQNGDSRGGRSSLKCQQMTHSWSTSTVLEFVLRDALSVCVGTAGSTLQSALLCACCNILTAMGLDNKIPITHRGESPKSPFSAVPWNI